MKIKLNECYLDMSILVCPACGCENLRHTNVEVFSGKKHLTIMPSGWADTDDNLEENPEKNDGLLIHFDCELCTAQPLLHLYQHKGETRLKMGYIAKETKWHA